MAQKIKEDLPFYFLRAQPDDGYMAQLKHIAILHLSGGGGGVLFL